MPSTSIAKFDYDPARRVLSVWFLTSGRRYDYADVPASLYAEFRAAFAKGHFFNRRIRNQFRYRRVEEQDVSVPIQPGRAGTPGRNNREPTIFPGIPQQRARR